MASEVSTIREKFFPMEKYAVKVEESIRQLAFLSLGFRDQRVVRGETSINDQ
jgi:hypothetical protein